MDINEIDRIISDDAITDKMKVRRIKDLLSIAKQSGEESPTFFKVGFPADQISPLRKFIGEGKIVSRIEFESVTSKGEWLHFAPTVVFTPNAKERVTKRELVFVLNKEKVRCQAVVSFNPPVVKINTDMTLSDLKFTLLVHYTDTKETHEN